ncbi:hypothetical protein ThrDRAFT_01544 [Frankia casuarinae]|nr:hypothetical protein ThrDRAFT_01544 [Frankia casuarinae]
MIRKFGSYP